MLPRLTFLKQYRFPVLLLLITCLVGINIYTALRYFTQPKKSQSSSFPPPPKEKVLSVETSIEPTASPTAVLTTQITKPVVKSTVSFGIVVNDYANKSGELSTLQSKVGKKFSTVSIFKQFGLPTNNALNQEDLAYIKSQGAKLMIAWEPWDPREGMQQSKDYLKEITEGMQDDYIKSFASSIKAFGSPVILRFGHEMNGTWYPWGSRPSEYIQAYRRVVTIFRNEGVGNVTYMWSINASPLSGISGYYPGNEYVDSIGIDGFNFGTTQSSSTWVSFGQIFQPAYRLVVSYGKPIFISETASTEVGGNKASWIRDMNQTLSTVMPLVKEVIWFNLQKETDWRLDSSSSSLQAFTNS